MPVRGEPAWLQNKYICLKVRELKKKKKLVYKRHFCACMLLPAAQDKMTLPSGRV